MMFRAEATLVWIFEADNHADASARLCTELHDIEVALGEDYEGYCDSSVEEIIINREAK